MEHHSFVSLDHAREIMGQNLIDVQVLERCLGVDFTQQHLGLVDRLPFSDAVLWECRDSHLLIRGFNPTILEFCAHPAFVASKVVYSGPYTPFYSDEGFAGNKRVDAGWYLLRKYPIENSARKGVKDQALLFGSGDDLPWACQAVHGIGLYFLATGERLFSAQYLRCKDIDSTGHRIGVGCFQPDGLKIVAEIDDSSENEFFVASSVKVSY